MRTLIYNHMKETKTERNRVQECKRAVCVAECVAVFIAVYVAVCVAVYVAVCVAVQCTERNRVQECKRARERVKQSENKE